MRIAIIGGTPDDERHLGRLAEKAGQAAVFIRSRAAAPAQASAAPGGAAGAAAPDGPPAGSAPPPAPGVIEHVLERLEREAPDEVAPGRPAVPNRPRALVFDAGQRPDAAARVIAAVRRDPYFERVGALLVVQAEHAGSLALPGGFDDFVLYPCGVEELTIRVRALRARRSALGKTSVIDDTGVVVDEASRDVIVDGRAVQLTAREFALFTYLCEWRGRVLSREHLLARVWGSRYSGGRRTVDIHVRRLRAKLGASLAIETLRGSGYRLRHEPSSAEAAPASAAYPAATHPALSHPDLSSGGLSSAGLSNGSLANGTRSNGALAHAALSHAALSHAALSHANLAYPSVPASFPSSSPSFEAQIPEPFSKVS